MAAKIAINEVGPRDGFQNVKDFIPTETKLKIIDMLADSGLKRIQITSFMNPKAVPQMKDSKEVAAVCLKKYENKGIKLSALTANRHGVDDAIACGLKHLAFVTSVTDSHNKANVRKTVDESVALLEEIIATYPNIDFVWDVSMAFGCIFEGEVSYNRLAHHIEKGVKIGLHQFNLCDTNGTATPDIIRDRVSKIQKDFPDCVFRVHIHDTRNMGMTNTLAAIEAGISEIEVAVGGMGGCPFSPGASGNTSTEDLVYMLNQMGYDTGVDFDKLLYAAKFTHEHIRGNFSGHQIKITNDRCYQ